MTPEAFDVGVLPDQIVSKIAVDTEGCWVWTMTLTTGGYGRIWINGRRQYAHRVVYGLLVGEIPEGLDIDHLCRNRACVNPVHLEPVTRGENIRRGLRSYALRTVCRKGLHDITRPDNIYTSPDGVKRQCLPCVQESHRAKTALDDEHNCEIG